LFLEDFFVGVNVEARTHAALDALDDAPREVADEEDLESEEPDLLDEERTRRCVGFPLAHTLLSSSLSRRCRRCPLPFRLEGEDEENAGEFERDRICGEPDGVEHTDDAGDVDADEDGLSLFSAFFLVVLSAVLLFFLSVLSLLCCCLSVGWCGC
jgi:hypothetical protein